jgi:hypothetical protein
MAIARLLFAATIAVGLPACSSSSPSTAASDDAGDDAGIATGGSEDDVVHTYQPTYTAIWNEILQPTCALDYCHAGATDDFLPMATKDTTYSALVGVTSKGPRCAQTGLKIVDPGNPDGSLLYQKVTTPTCGVRMPAEYEPYLDSKETGQIQQWIINRAPDN